MLWLKKEPRRCMPAVPRVLSGHATEIISNSPIEEMIVTDTIPLNESASSLQRSKFFPYRDY